MKKALDIVRSRVESPRQKSSLRTALLSCQSPVFDALKTVDSVDSTSNYDKRQYSPQSQESSLLDFTYANFSDITRTNELACSNLDENSILDELQALLHYVPDPRFSGMAANSVDSSEGVRGCIVIQSSTSPLLGNTSKGKPYFVHVVGNSMFCRTNETSDLPSRVLRVAWCADIEDRIAAARSTNSSTSQSDQPSSSLVDTVDSQQTLADKASNAGSPSHLKIDSSDVELSYQMEKVQSDSLKERSSIERSLNAIQISPVTKNVRSRLTAFSVGSASAFSIPSAIREANQNQSRNAAWGPNSPYLKTSTKYGGLFVANQEAEAGSCTFKIFTPQDVIICTCSSVEERSQFVAYLAKSLETSLGPELFAGKVEAALRIRPFLEEQFSSQLSRNVQLVELLTESGLLAETSILRMPAKDMMGSLEMWMEFEFASKSSLWKDMMFVLADGHLYWFLDSHSSIPESFVTLRIASVQLDVDSLACGQNVFTVTTPLRTIVLRAKHHAALAEWVSAIETAILNERLRKIDESMIASGRRSSRQEVKALQKTRHHDLEIHRRRYARNLLLSIESMQSPTSSLESLLLSDEGRKLFEQYCELVGATPFLTMVAKLTQIDQLLQLNQFGVAINIVQDLQTNAALLAGVFAEEKTKALLKNIDEETVEETKIKKFHDAFWGPVVDKVEGLYSEFRQSEEYRAFSKKVDETRRVSSQELSNPLNNDILPTFAIQEKNADDIIKVQLSTDQCSISIGRDVSSDVMISDNGISRSHLRLELDEDGKCSVCDLGSSCGTKVNGRLVTFEYIHAGDTIEIGKMKISMTLEKRIKPLHEWLKDGLTKIFDRSRRMFASQERSILLKIDDETLEHEEL